jgi:serine protease Do
MSSAVNRVVSPSILIDRPWDAVISALRQVTVEIFGPTGSRGAGVVWSSDGLIVTNAHVIRGNARVRLEDGRTCSAELVSSNQKADLSLLHVPLPGIKSVRTRDSRSLRTGEIVVAVGHPLGETGAASFGIVHSACRGDFIAADLRLAPGNSGGPLADAEGRVVGINCIVANGLGVAISIQAIERFLKSSLFLTERAG